MNMKQAKQNNSNGLLDSGKMQVHSRNYPESLIKIIKVLRRIGKHSIIVEKVIVLMDLVLMFYISLSAFRLYLVTTLLAAGDGNEYSITMKTNIAI